MIEQATRGRRRLCFALFVLIAAAVCVGTQMSLLTGAWYRDRPMREVLPPRVVDDASRLNRTSVREVVAVEHDPAAAERQLRELLDRARRESLKVAVAGARHTMGGHTIYPGGVVLDMAALDGLEIDEQRRVLRVGAGARWSQVLPELDRVGLSIGVMQSNNDFSIGGSLGVNCHGWQHARPPIASTVEALRVMRADGTIVRCSRDENRELLSLVLGGYGLTGIILEADLRLVPNDRYRGRADVVAIDDFARSFKQAAAESDVGMAYGRLCIVPGRMFLQEGLLITWRRDMAEAPESSVAIGGPPPDLLLREVYRSQIGSREGKEMRWRLEKTASANMSKRMYPRNRLLNASAELFREMNADRTDILHEYFVPPERFAEFAAELYEILPRHSADLLNITVRHVLRDDDSFLRYADRELLSLVMLFNQPRTVVDNGAMQALTRELIDAVLRCDGRFYLPYRLHATPEQFHKCYPQAAEFFALKRRYDPGELFQNEFYRKYGR